MSTPVLLSKNLVHQKIKGILVDITELKTLLARYPYERLVTDEVQCTVAERRLERLINRALDINFHLIRSTGSPPPDDYTQSFLLLGQLKILSAKLAASLAPAAGARNILIHSYDDLDAQRFYSSLQDAVRLFPEYLRAIEKYIETKN